MTKALSLLAFVAALVVGAWGQQPLVRINDCAKIADSDKSKACYVRYVCEVYPQLNGCDVVLGYDLPAVKKTLHATMVAADSDEACRKMSWEKSPDRPMDWEFDGAICTLLPFRELNNWQIHHETPFYTCISPTLPPGLALVVSEDLTRGWCVGPHFKPQIENQ